MGLFAMKRGVVGDATRPTRARQLDEYLREVGATYMPGTVACLGAAALAAGRLASAVPAPVSLACHQ